MAFSRCELSRPNKTPTLRQPYLNGMHGKTDYIVKSVMAGGKNLVPWRHLWAKENRSGRRESINLIAFLQVNSCC